MEFVELGSLNADDAEKMPKVPAETKNVGPCGCDKVSNMACKSCMRQNSKYLAKHLNLPNAALNVYAILETLSLLLATIYV